MANFNWHGDDADAESVVMPSVQAVAVYSNERGDIVMRQQGYQGEDDSLVIFPRAHAQSIINAISNELKAE